MFFSFLDRRILTEPIVDHRRVIHRDFLVFSFLGGFVEPQSPAEACSEQEWGRGWHSPAKWEGLSVQGLSTTWGILLVGLHCLAEGGSFSFPLCKLPLGSL